MNLETQTKIKNQITSIIKLDFFKNTLRKLTIGEILTNNEKEYILSISLMFLKYYSNDNRNITYSEFAYYIILKYSISYNDFQPLYDFSTNLGFYPISKFILKNKLIEDYNIFDFFINEQLNNFNNGEYIETLEQKNTKFDLLKDNNKEISYIAPTSYGKSSIIIDYLSKLNLDNKKIAIIVPSKSLLVQTYKVIKKAKINTKILIHDEMYSDNDSFVAIFTQERALRLLKKNEGLYFDILFIDEAHNLFEKDSRSILLSRLISKNLLLNNEAKNIYLSPLITDSNNLKINSNQNIISYKIDFNIKEPELYEYTKDNDIYMHNRFIIGGGKDYKGYKLGKEDNYLNYIFKNSGDKNFLYHRNPKQIEDIALELLNLPDLENIPDKINELMILLGKEVSEKFYGIELLKKGVVYIHGKMPDLIKEYLEYKFKEIKELKYIVANSVILEGINLPIDTLFILHTAGLKGKSLVNLVGRVNRLNYIFSETNNNLSKLLPKIHFMHTKFEDGRIKQSQLNAIKDLRNKIFEDKISNPVLKEFDLDKFLSGVKEDDKIKKRKSIISIQENEKFLLEESDDKKINLKKYLIENGINEFYKCEFFNKAIDKIFDNLNNDFSGLDYLDKINKIFIEGFCKKIGKDEVSYINEYEIERLKYKQARDYYKYFIDINLKQSLNNNIKENLKYFNKRRYLPKDTDRKFYFGPGYGEEPYKTIKYPNPRFNVYIDIKKKNNIELINLIIVKIKLEENFISFKLNKLIVFLYDYKIISEKEYNLYVYGTEDKNFIKYINGGLTASLAKRLEEEKQLYNIESDINGNLVGNNEFNEYKNGIDDFYRFELERFIN